MTTKEFSDQFDVLFNNITSNQAPGLNEYEKSVFLTKAQDELVKNYFVPEGNLHQKGFDGSQKRQIDFSKLICSSYISKFNNNWVMDPRAFHLALPKGIMYIINESVQFYDNVDEPDDPTGSGIDTPLEQKAYDVKATRQVIPLTYDEYTRLMSKPFKEPVKYQAWRLITNSTSNSTEVDIVITSSDRKKYEVTTNYGMLYVIRYVKRPQPIILVNLEDSFGDVSIHDEIKETPCELDPSIHDEILQRAVELAKAAWVGDLNSTIEVGKRSE